MHRLGKNCNQQIRLSFHITLLAFFAINVGCCFYLPIPAIQLSSDRGVVPGKIINSLKPGITTHADVLLLLGDQDKIYFFDLDSTYPLDRDRFLTYYWCAEEGFWSVTVPPAPGGVGGYVPIAHVLCIEFDDANKVKRYKHFKTGITSGIFESVSDYDKIAEEIIEWVNASEN